MKLLLDEGVPTAILPAVRAVLAGHDILHVDDLGWKGKKDVPLFRDAQQKGFEAILTTDLGQARKPLEVAALLKYGLHDLRYPPLPRGEGRRGMARVMGSVIIALPYVMQALEEASSPQVVTFLIADGGVARYQTEVLRRRRNT